MRMKTGWTIVAAVMLVPACAGGSVLDDLTGRQSIVQLWDEREDPYLHHQTVVPPRDSALRGLYPYAD